MTRTMSSKRDLTIPLAISFITHSSFVLLLSLFYLYGSNYVIEPFFVDVVGPFALKGTDIPHRTTPKISPPYGEGGGNSKANTRKGNNGSTKTPPLIGSGNHLKEEPNGSNSKGSLKGSAPNRYLPVIPEGVPFTNKNDLEKYAKVDQYTLKKGADPIKKNIDEFKYTAYFAKLKRRLETVGSYPAIARPKRLQGEVRINFTILRDGRLGSLTLVGSSGYRILDEAALNLLNNAAPYEVFPVEWQEERLIIPLRVIYRINNIYVF